MTRRKKQFDLGCCEAREGLSAMLDDEVAPGEVAALEAHLEECVDCATYYADLRSLHARLAEELTESRNLDHIWERVEWAMAAYDARSGNDISAERSGTWRQTPSIRRWAGAAIAAMLLIGVFIGGQQFLQPRSAELPVVTETIRDFETFRLRGGLLDVTAKEPNVVRRWMAAKVDFKLPDNVTPPEGFKIAGGRLCSFLNRRLAFFHYEKGAAAMSFYVMKASGLKLPDHGSKGAVVSRQGLTTMTWAQAGLAYVVVSDLPVNEVKEFASRLMTRSHAL